MFNLNVFYSFFRSVSIDPETEKEESAKTSPVATRILKREREPEVEEIVPGYIKLLEQMPRDVYQDILAPMLKLNDLAALSFVCRDMKAKTAAMIQQAWDMRRKAMTIGPEEWKKVGVEVTDLPALPKDIDQILKEPCPFNRGKRVYQTHKLLLMPAGSSINDQGERMRHLREGNEPNIYHISNEKIEQQLANNKIKNSYWALITHTVIPASRDKNYTRQKELFEKFPGYAMSTVLEAINLVTMHLEYSGEYLLPVKPWTMARCEEVINGFPWAVGLFASSGLSVVEFTTCPGYGYGFLAVRKFC